MMNNYLRPQLLHRTAASRELVLSTDQVAAPNDEITPNGMKRTPELYLRPMQTSNDMSIRSARGK